jgi:hypothetical protein
MNSHFRKAHDLQEEKITEAAKAFAREIDRGQNIGAGIVEGGRPSSDDGEGWDVEYTADVEEDADLEIDHDHGHKGEGAGDGETLKEWQEL